MALPLPWLLACLLAQGRVSVSSDAELRAALARAAPGTRILVAPGAYAGGVVASGIRGTESRPVIVAGADPANPPVFRGGSSGWHLTQVEHVELRDLRVEASTANGVNIDDGGDFGRPSRHVKLVNLHVESVGGNGNHDGVKLSGVVDFRVEGCTIAAWGANGSAIDMVGCHKGFVESCRFTGRGADGGSGVQMKGGSSGIVLGKSRFENAGARAVNIGGSTGREYFRPPLTSEPGSVAEARDVTVEGCTIFGSTAAIACVGVDGAVVRFNTIVEPARWALRILQESRGPEFVPCRRVRFTDNLVAFRLAGWSEGGVNIGPGTEPATFVFERNAWTCLDDPGRSRPKLPSPEKDGVYGLDPQFRDPASRDWTPAAGSKAASFGAGALK